MKLLVVKTSSFGDVLHAFPALTDAWRRVDGLVCDWLVEDAFAAMPAWHPAVRHVIPVSMRTWRRPPWIHQAPSLRRFVRRLRRETYDLVVDAQGLLKSAALARLARGPCIGYGPGCAREPLAARLYGGTVDVDARRHAVDRNRALFAAALGYDIPPTLDYGLRLPDAGDQGPYADAPYLVFVPGTTWPSKRWPARYWRTLADVATRAGWRIHIPAGSRAEQALAAGIAEGLTDVEVRSELSLDGLARLLRDARAVVSVDSGPGHLAGALDTPGVSIYGATDPALTGIRGRGQSHLRADFECAPCLRRRCQFTDNGQIHPDCYATVPPDRVWSTLRGLIQAR